MPKETVKDLIKFLKPYPRPVRELALWLREFVWDLYPKSNELIYDNYNAVAFGWSTSARLGDTFCSVAAFEGYVHFGFYWGNQIADPEKRLSGKGNQYRYIKISDRKDFPKTYIKKLLNEAHVNSLANQRKNEPRLEGATIVKSISPKKRRPK